MCSIVGYVGTDQASPILVESLQQMEYRGYDSVGIATNSDSKISVKKGIGKVKEVNNNEKLDSMLGNMGIGHTRWATHGRVNIENAHPHMCNSNSIGVVHNGIIENHVELKEELENNHNIVFKSSTDTEVIPNLLQVNFEKSKDIKKAVIDTMDKLKGHYSFVALFKTGEMVGVKNHEPLILGMDKTDLLLTSDVVGMPESVSSVIYLENNQFVIIKEHNYKIFDFGGNVVQSVIKEIPKYYQSSTKGQYEHFTIKEINEQVHTIIKAGSDLDEINNTANLIHECKRIWTIGSGSSYNSGLFAKYLFAQNTKIQIENIGSGEAQYFKNFFNNDSLLLTISQSGESSNVLEAVSLGKKNGARISSIVNEKNSSLSRESEFSIGINCGPEIGISATKSFTSQIVVLYKLLNMLNSNPNIDSQLSLVAEGISKILKDQKQIISLSSVLRNTTNLYVLGTGIHYPIAKEGALKIKEITYVHAEGIHGGELIHGPLALIDASSFVIIINPDDDFVTHENVLHSASECKSRGAKVIGISNKNNEIYDFWIPLPVIPKVFYPILEIVTLQLLSYHMAIRKGIDPDYPRNLAKSITVK